MLYIIIGTQILLLLLVVVVADWAVKCVPIAYINSIKLRAKKLGAIDKGNTDYFYFNKFCYCFASPIAWWLYWQVCLEIVMKSNGRF